MLFEVCKRNGAALFRHDLPSLTAVAVVDNVVVVAVVVAVSSDFVFSMIRVVGFCVWF